MDEPWKHAKWKKLQKTHIMIPFIWNVQNRQTDKRQKITGCLKLVPLGRRVEGGMGVIINEYGGFFARGVGGDEKVIVVMVAQVCEHTKTTDLYTWNWWMVCENCFKIKVLVFLVKV